MLRSEIPAPSLAPRLGQEVVRESGGVAYRELRTVSLVGRCSSLRMPFQWTANPYRGCAMGCRYCYAAYTHEYLGATVPESFHSAVWVKTGSAQQTARRLAAIVRRGERIALGTATDPYQPGEARFGVTRRFLESVARLRGARLAITTKGAVILRDLELLRRIHERSGPTREKYLGWLEREFPRHLQAYRHAYRDGAQLAGAYRRRIEAAVERLRRKHGLGAAWERQAPVPGQLRLWS